MKGTSLNWQTMLLIVAIGLLLADVFVTMKLSQEIEQTQLCAERRRALPCEAIPTQFAMNEPECANKLLRAMNVTNVRFLPPGRIGDHRLNQTMFG